MDTVFDNVSRILAQPRPRRATLRLVIGTAASAAITAVLPGRALAWGTVPCNDKVCSDGQVCCDWLLSACCASRECLKNATGMNVCCPVGKVCGGICCGALETCCGSGSSSRCCETVSGKATCKSSSASVMVCEQVPVQTCDPTVCEALGPAMRCVNGTCKCDQTTCASLGLQLELPLSCETGECLPAL
jgi:hypothetical protein